jgi:hypothetical protein
MPQDDFNDQPALFIPTYSRPPFVKDDTGADRPVPVGVLYYLCPGIRVMTPFQPGSPLTVQVTVGNWGGGTSCIARVGVYWSLPFSGQIIPNPDKLIGSISVEVKPYGGKATTNDIILIKIPLTAPPHICLLAKVEHSQDPLPLTWMPNLDRYVEIADPINDRHWAQHNLVAGSAGSLQTIQFLATNPMLEAARFDLIVQPLGREKWSALTEAPVSTVARFRLSGPEGDAETTGDNTLRHPVILKAGEYRNMTLSVGVPEPLRPGTFAAFEVLQFKSDKPVGGFGIVLRADR